MRVIQTQDLLAEVIDRYLASRDFNGYYVGAGSDVSLAAGDLIQNGALEVIGEQDFPNPHIRPWSSRRSLTEQLEALRAAVEGETYGICLYPTAVVLRDHPKLGEFAAEPYRARLALGAGALEVAYFRMDVLEAYRNDPRFSFRFDDFGAHAAVRDEVYEDEDEPPEDKVSMRLGFAYRVPMDEKGPIVRLVCAFLRDLARLSPLHQRRWETYEVSADGAEPHPVWWAEAMGHWLDRIGPFEWFMSELSAWNELHERAFGTPLLRTTERPPELGWVLRPSQLEFDQFVQCLDKLLYENLRHEAFDSAGIARKDDTGQNRGTLNRLDLFLTRLKTPDEQRRAVLKPFRDVRSARAKPAHAIRKNISDANFVRRQADVLSEVTESVYLLRKLWARHPRNKGWTEPA